MNTALENLEVLLQNVAAACSRSGRSLSDIEIVAASKMRSITELQEVWNSGRLSAFGENRVQEFMSKYDPRFCWDIIGQLQSNKVKYVIDKVRLIHSVDRESLLSEIDSQAEKHGKKQKILVEINSGAEENKGGIVQSEAVSFIKKVMKYKNIELSGLMAVAPLEIEREDLRKLFLNVKTLYDSLSGDYGFSVLSMGMSNDYALAIECGSTLIRPGRALFGERIVF